MSKIKDILKEFSDKGILTEESVTSLVKEFDSAVDSKVKKLREESFMGIKGDNYGIHKQGQGHFKSYVLIDDETSDMVDMQFSSIDEAQKYADKKGLNVTSVVEEDEDVLETDEGTLVEGADSIEEEVKRRVDAKMKTVEEDVQAFKEKLEIETNEMIKSYLEEFVIPNADTMIIEEAIKEQSAHLIEETLIKDEAIDTLTNLTNKLSSMIKKDPVRTKIIEEAKQTQLKREKEDVIAKSARIKKDYITKKLKKRAN